MTHHLITLILLFIDQRLLGAFLSQVLAHLFQLGFLFILGERSEFLCALFKGGMTRFFGVELRVGLVAEPLAAVCAQDRLWLQTSVHNGEGRADER